MSLFNNNLVPDDCECWGDLNIDDQIDLADLEIMLASYGASGDAGPESGDLDGDGDVDIRDLAHLLGMFGLNCQ